MPEILTESFCERCGTRYTFESAAPRASRLKGVKVLSRGLKNFVLSDDSTLDEAMAAARSDTDREQTAQQLDAFHKTFNFCMSCRQYTCANCWNEAEGRCLTCAPHLGHEIMPAPFPDLDVAAALEAASNGNGHAHDHATLEPLAWPTSDLVAASTADPVEDAAPAEAMTSAPGDDAETEDAAAETVESIDAVARLAALQGTDAPTEAEASPVEATAEATVEPPVTPVTPAAPTEIDVRAAAAADATARLLRAFRPGESLDDALEAYERGLSKQAEAEPEPEPQAEVAAQAEPEPQAEVAAQAEPEPQAEVAAQAEVEPEPQAVVAAQTETEPPVEVAAQAEPEPPVEVAAQAEPEPPAEVPAQTPRVDRVAQPTWQVVAPDPEPATPTAPPVPASAEPSWPAQPQWPTRESSAGLPFLGRPANPTGGIEALWAESAREVSTAPASRPGPAATATIAPCVSCGLSLSANARFCRRCGTRQG